MHQCSDADTRELCSSFKARKLTATRQAATVGWVENFYRLDLSPGPATGRDGASLSILRTGHHATARIPYAMAYAECGGVGHHHHPNAVGLGIVE